jgi:hypothetical protein
MAVLLGAAAGFLAFGVAWVGLRLVGCPAALVKGLAVLAGLGVGVMAGLRVLDGRRRAARSWRDSDGISGVGSVLGDVLDAADPFD